MQLYELLLFIYTPDYIPELESFLRIYLSFTLYNMSTTRPSAELRPRQTQSTRARVVRSTTQPELYEIVLSYISLYRNMRPAFQYTSSRGVLYNTYHLLTSPVYRSTGASNIPRFFIHPTTNKICTIRVGEYDTIGLAILNEHSTLTILRECEITNTDELYIIIPRMFISEFYQMTINDATERITTHKPDIIHSIRELSVVMTPDTGDSTNIECTICYVTQTANEFVEYQCRHSHCLDCFTKHIKMNQNNSLVVCCPLCRAKIVEATVRTERVRDVLVDYIQKL
jgi:hypothetical protein